VLDKTVGITAARLNGLKGRLVSESRCPHEVQALAERLRTVQGDLILIAGASAITDRLDVLPAAIERAGGRIDHFGMPVDPGNLLLLARLGARPVLGLPGCARSPKLNGFDWVLQRLFAGMEVTSGDVMDMGVGGLLS
jgi:molybdenum cofactor cytidylyltransferase